MSSQCGRFMRRISRSTVALTLGRRTITSRTKRLLFTNLVIFTIAFSVLMMMYKQVLLSVNIERVLTEHVDPDILTVLREQKKHIGKTEHVDPDIRTVLRELEEPIGDTDFKHIFRGDLADESTWKFEFAQTSKRRFGRKYSELTSYDPEGRNLDFFNPVKYDGNSMVMFEDNGAGIVQRFLFIHRHFGIDKVFLLIEVDGVLLKNTTMLETSPDGNYPFKRPFFRPNDRHNIGGYYLTFPVSYQHSIRISAHLTKLPKMNGNDVYNKTKYCKAESKPCPVRAYFATTFNKFVQGVKLKTTFRDYYPPKPRKNIVEANRAVSIMATTPERYGPGMKSDCHLTCQSIPPGGEVTIFSAENTAKVIQSLLFRVYDRIKEKFVVSEHWQRMLLSITWDGKASQVKDIPLAGLFTVGFGYLREANSLMAGMQKKSCTVRGEGISIPDNKKTDWVAYLFYEMPFWKSARITVKRPRGFGPAVICTQVTAKKLNTVEYNPRLTGYFSVQLNQYAYNFDGHKTVLKVENEWGHVVAVNQFISNYKYRSTKELDIIIETDNAKAPVISGTGLEDYFGYVLDFRKFNNSSSILNGVPYYLHPKDSALRIARTYRHMLLDPILFTKSIRIYLEGFFDRKKTPIKRKFAHGSSSFSQATSEDSLLTVAMFYGRKGPGGITTDHVDYGDHNSTAIHNVRYSSKEIKRFKVHTMFENQPGVYFTRWIVSLNAGQQVKHTLKIRRKNAGVILRREYRSVVANQKAKVTVDGEDAGTWFCLQKALTEDFSLRIDDHHIPPRLTVNKDTIEVTFEAITTWESSSIEVTSVILSLA